MNIQVTTRVVGDVTIVDVAGRLTLGPDCERFRKVLSDLARQRRILINLRHVSYVDSSGLGALVSAYATGQNNGSDVRLLHVADRVRDLLTITKLYTVFEVFEDEEQALRSYQSGRRPSPKPETAYAAT